jgi:hypothetical protein
MKTTILSTNRVHRSLGRFTLLLVSLLIGFFALCQQVQSATDTPDPGGSLPVSNTADGHLALASLTTGIYNSAFGIYSLLSLTDGDFCTGVGAGTLLANTADENTAVGAGALLSTAAGGSNTAAGAFALFSNTATGNTAIGSRALLNNTTGGTLENIVGFDVGPNVAVGWQALESNTVAGANTAVGYQALQSFMTGPMGFEQLGASTAVGFQGLANATGAGAGNSGFGYQALMNNTDGAGNTAIGLQALFNNTTGNSNVAIGNNVLLNNATGDNNTASGFGALENNTGGSNNTAIGAHALGANLTGDGNIGVGSFAGGAVSTANNVICIGVLGENVDDSCYIGNIFSETAASGVQVFVNSNHKLGTMTSSKRFKEEIKPMANTSEALFGLKPVTFRYKKEIDPSGTSQLGLVAEEVEKVDPDLVVRDKEGKPYSVRYDQVNAMLLNEFLKAHRKIEEQEAAIARQQEQIEALTAGLQKVNAQLEANKSTRQVALKDR